MKRKWSSERNVIGKTKKSKGREALRITMSLAIACIYSSNAKALPQGPSIASGSVGFVNNGSSMDVRQKTDRAVINWQQFGIQPGESVNFIQPSSSSLVLNRITGINSSLIEGKINASGQVFIINPNGVLFGEKAEVSAAGIVASTLGISDKDFMAGNFQFSKLSTAPAGSVKNSGSIIASQGGYIVLLSDELRNNGDITAPAGRVLMGAGNQVALYFAKNSLIGYKIDKETANAIVENTGTIKAAGGTISLEAIGLNDLTKSAVVNNTGIIEAKTLRNISGKIELLADARRGRVNLGGTLDASATEGGGGTINTFAAHVSTDADAVITTHAVNGQTGLWKIRTANGSIGNDAGDIHTNVISKNLSSSNIKLSVHGNNEQDTGNLTVDNAISSIGQNKLTLEAEKNVLINAPVNVGTGGLMIRTDLNGTGTGVLVFGRDGKISASSNAAIDIYTNVESYTNNTIYNNFITSPYRLWMLVNNVDQLQKINENLSANYAIGRDIDATETALWNQGGGNLPRYIWNYNTGFIPLGFNSVNQFTGKLDGLNHVISNLYINRPIGSRVGLFSSSSGEIRNLGLVNVNITGNDSVGALVGNNNGKIDNVYVTGTVSNNVKPGYSEIAPNSIGGIVGKNTYTGEIRNAYSLTTVTGPFLNSGIGGIAGTNAGKIDGVYAIWYNSRNGITGINSGKITNAYWTTDGTGQADAVGSNSGNTGGYVENGYLTAAELKNAKLNFDFEDAWVRYDGYTFPLLKSFLKPLEVLSVDTNVAKVYDGVTVDLQPKLLYSDANASSSSHLYSTSDPNFKGIIDVGNVSYQNTKRFWSDQQGYYLQNSAIDQAISMNVDARPLIVEAVTESKQFDASVNSSFAPQVSQVSNDRNMGLAEGDVMSAQQIFDSNAIGNRTLQVANLEIKNSEGKNVTNNYKIVKLNASGSILEKQATQDPGGTTSNPPNNPDPTPPAPPQVDPAKPGENPTLPVSTPSGDSPGDLGGKGTGGEGMGNNGLGGNGTNSGNDTNTANAGSPSNSGNRLPGARPPSNYSKSDEFLALTNVDKDEEYRKLIKAKKSKSTVSLTLQDDGIHLPKEITQ